MARTKFLPQLSISLAMLITMLVLLTSSNISGSPLQQVTIPAMKLPYVGGYVFSGGPHAAPVVFSLPCKTEGQELRDVSTMSGLDFVLPSQTPVLAVADGRVSDLTPRGGGIGNIVAIDHEGGLRTEY